MFTLSPTQHEKMRRFSTKFPHEHTSSSDSELGSSEDTLRAITSQLLDDLPNQTAEAQERLRVASQLTRVGLTRVNAQEVVEKLCLESLGSVSELPPAMEGNTKSVQKPNVTRLKYSISFS